MSIAPTQPPAPTATATPMPPTVAPTSTPKTVATVGTKQDGSPIPARTTKGDIVAKTEGGSVTNSINCNGSKVTAIFQIDGVGPLGASIRNVQGVAKGGERLIAEICNKRYQFGTVHYIDTEKFIVYFEIFDKFEVLP